MKATELEAPPPGGELVTITLSVPAVTRSLAGTVTVTRLEVIVGFERFEEPNVTVAPATKFVPLIVSCRLLEPAAALDGESDVMVGTGLFALLMTIDSALVAVCFELEESWT